MVLSQSEKARASQKEILEFLLTSHPLDCPVCDKGGECPLQNLTMAHGFPAEPLPFRRKAPRRQACPAGRPDLAGPRALHPMRPLHPLPGRDCRGAGAGLLPARPRHATSSPIPSRGFDSIFSGNTTDICPVGALTTADFRFGARPWEMKAAASICAHCPVGCNITFNTRREAKSDGKVVIKRVMPRQNEQVNEIWMCDKGRFAYHFTESEDRLDKAAGQKEWQAGSGFLEGRH